MQLFTRRRDIKSPFPWASDAVTEVSDIAEATARKLRNLRANAPVYETDMRAMLPNKPIETGRPVFAGQCLLPSLSKTLCHLPVMTFAYLIAQRINQQDAFGGLAAPLFIGLARSNLQGLTTSCMVIL